MPPSKSVQQTLVYHRRGVKCTTNTWQLENSLFLPCTAKQYRCCGSNGFAARLAPDTAHGFLRSSDTRTQRLSLHPLLWQQRSLRVNHPSRRRITAMSPSSQPLRWKSTRDTYSLSCSHRPGPTFHASNCRGQCWGHACTRAHATAASRSGREASSSLLANSPKSGQSKDPPVCVKEGPPPRAIAICIQLRT